jgi:hypothetical protein
MKFKEGDVLVFVNTDRRKYSAQAGAKAIFKGIVEETDDELITVEWIRDGLDNKQDDGGYFVIDFKKVEEEVTQKEDRIFEENKKKVMKFNFEEGKQRVIAMMSERIDDFTHDMFQDIRSVINEDRDETLSQIEEIIESIRFTKRNIENATEQVKSATSIQEILEAMNDTMFEGMEETVLGELFNVDFIVE